MYTTDSSFREDATGTAAQWRAAIAAHNDADAAELVRCYTTFAPQANTNYDLALAQAVQETGWFTSDHYVNQRNMAGLGVTGPGVAGPTFTSIESGVKAHLEHLNCYIGAADEPVFAQWGMLDPRHAFHDNMPRVSDLVRPNRKWANPGTNYADAIVGIANRVAGGGPAPVPTPTPDIAIIDVRDQLPTNPSGGSGQVFGPKQGVIIHYSAVNYPADRAILDIMVSEANYHIGPYLGEAGLAYHYVVDPQTGDIYQARDADAVLWHCGAWPENRTWYSVHIPGGSSLVMSDAAVAALAGLCRSLAARDGFDAGSVKGHREVSSTSCPGPLMDQFVLPYRAGTIAPTPPAPPPAFVLPGADGVDKDVGEGIYRLVTATAEADGARLRTYGLAKDAQHDEYLVVPADEAQRRRNLAVVALPVVVVNFERVPVLWDRGRTPAPWDTRVPMQEETIGPADDPYIDAILKGMHAAELAAQRGL